MSYPSVRLVAALLLTAPPLAVQAQEDAFSPRETPYVNITIEVDGLEQTTDLLNSAVAELSATLERIAASPDDMTPEQIAAFADLADRTNALVVSLDRTLQGLGPAIRETEAPAREVLAGLLDTARVRTIDPTLASVDRRVKTWLLLTFLGALLIAGLVGVGLYASLRQLRAMARVLGSIGDDYMIVPRQFAAPPVPAAPSAPEVASAPYDRPAPD